MSLMEKLFKDMEDEEKKPEGVEEEAPVKPAEPEPVATEEEPKEPKVEAEMDVDKMADRFASKIVDAIQKANKLSSRDAEDVRSKFFAPETGMQGIKYPENYSQLKSMKPQEKIVTWFKALIREKYDPDARMVLKALVEGTDALGGYLVPEEFSNEVIRCLPDVSVMRRIARVWPMQTDTLNIPTLAATPAAYWTAEYASKATTSAEFGQVQLSPNDLVCLIPVTHQLIADANIDIIRFITELFVERIGVAEDKAFFTGSGSGQPQGVASCSGILTYSAGGVLNFDDMISAYYKVPQAHRNSPRAAWVASKKVIEILHKVKDSSTGRYVWLPAGMDEVTKRPVDMILGHPVYEQNDIAEDQLYFGDWGMYAIGDRQRITVTTTNEGGDAWRRNATEIKAVERVDGKCLKGCALVKVSGIQS